MKTEGWSGKGRSGAVPQWKLEARKAENIARHPNFSMGGSPRKHQKKPVPSMPKLKCLDAVTEEPTE